MNDADLTIIMPLWNKAKYIADALDSIYRQKTRFSYHIIVADDHSTDGSLNIVARYEAQHPGTITVLKSDTNQKLYKNVIRAYAITKTPYFCVLDPDDFWMSEAHVENALSYLSTHPDFTIYSARIQPLGKDGERRPCLFPTRAADSDFADYLRGKSVIAFTQTCVYRNVVFSKGLPQRLLEYESPTKERTLRGDSFRNFLHIREGKAHYSPAIEGCYRLTGEGIYAGTNSFDQHLLNAQLFVDIWQYDKQQHVELLYRSWKIYRKAKKCVTKMLADQLNNNEKSLHNIHELNRLRDLYFMNSMRLIQCGIIRAICKKKDKFLKSVAKRIKRHRINKALKTARYVHLIYDDKFAKPFVDFMRNFFPKNEHVFICDCYMHFPFDEDQTAFKVSNCFKGIHLDRPNIEKIICHSLYVRGAVDFFYSHPKLLREKAYWLIYGGDLYDAPRDEKNDFVRQNFRGYLASYDAKVLRNRYNARNIIKVYIPCPITAEMLCSLSHVPGACVQIQINNSCDESTLGMLEVLSRFRERNIRITTVLSYGDMRFKERVLQLGYKLFKGKFKPILEYMAPVEYARHLASNDILILNQNRQQGCGNILISLCAGVKVFIKSTTTTYKTYTNDGMAIGNTDDIANMSFEEFTSRANLDKNPEIAHQYYSEEVWQKGWEAALEDEHAKI